MKRRISQYLFVSATLICIVSLLFYVINSQSTNESGFNKIVKKRSLFNYSLDKLISDSDVIISGETEKILPDKWNNANNKKPDTITGTDTIFKDHIIKVDSVLKGNIKDNKVIIRTFEGTVDGFTIEDEGQPVINSADRFIAFLVKDRTLFNISKSDGHFMSLGNIQGIYILKNDIAKNSKEEISISHLLSKIKNYQPKLEAKEDIKSDE